MRTINPAKVGVYIRWSTEDQGQGHTLAIQSDACRHYCLSQGWAVQEQLIYVDDGWSGSSLDRPGMSRLRSDVATGNVEAVVVYKLDRLSRNIKDVIALVLDEWESRCIVRSTMEPIDTASDTGKLTFTLLSSFADFERGTIRARTLSGKKKNAEQGRNAGSPYPFGYERGDKTGTYRVVESEAAVVRQVFEMYSQGMGCLPIADRLNEMGIENRTSGPGRHRLSPGKWSNTAVLRVLSNPIYTGQLVYGRNSRNPRLGKEGERYYIKNDPSQVIRVPSQHIPPIIDKETFAKTEQIRTAKQNPNFGKRAVSSVHLLTGMLWCFSCDHSVGGRKGNGKNYSYYWCSGAKNKGAAVCRAGQIRADVVDQMVMERLEAVYGGTTAQMSDEWEQVVVRKRQTLEQLLSRVNGELSQVRQAEQRLTHDYTSGTIKGQGYQHLYDSLRTRAEGLEAGVQDLRRQLENLETEAEGYKDRVQSYVTLRDSFDTLTAPQKKLLLKHLIHRILVYKEVGSKTLDLHIDFTGAPTA